MLKDDAQPVLANPEIDRPYHYNTGNIEAIDYLEDNLPDVAFIGYLDGNVKKYMHRWRYKGRIKDLLKARWYLNRLINKLKQETQHDADPSKAPGTGRGREEEASYEEVRKPDFRQQLVN